MVRTKRSNHLSVVSVRSVVSVGSVNEDLLIQRGRLLFGVTTKTSKKKHSNLQMQDINGKPQFNLN
jgi:hypothetical protein